MKRINLFLLTLLFYPLISVWGKTSAWTDAAPLLLNISESIQRAIQHSESVQIRDESIERMRGSYKRIRAEALPQLTGEATWDKILESPVLNVEFGGTSQTFSLKDDYEFAAMANLKQVVYAFGKVSTAIDIAEQSILLEQALKNLAADDIAYLTKQIYYTLIYARDAAQIAEESHQNAVENQKELANRFRSGRISRMDNVKMAADVEARIPVKLEAQNQYDALQISFNRLIGTPEDTKIILTSSYPENFPGLNHEELKPRMLQSEPELITMRKNLVINKNILRLRRADYYPSLEARANVTHARNGPSTFPADDLETSSYAGLEVKYPFWDSGRRKGVVLEAESDQRIAALNLQKKERDLLEELKKTISQYDATRGIYKAALRARDLAQTAYHITLSSFKSGTASQTQLNDAELHFTKAKLSAKSSQYELSKLLAKIERLTGQP